MVLGKKVCFWGGGGGGGGNWAEIRPLEKVRKSSEKVPEYKIVKTLNGIII